MKTKPIGVRFDEEMVNHFKERGCVSHQQMLNACWADYAARNGIWKGKVSIEEGKAFIKDLTNEPPKTNHSINTEIIKKQIEAKESDLKYLQTLPKSLLTQKTIRSTQVEIWNLQKQLNPNNIK